MISVCGLKGAPGASTTALLIAALWPDSAAVLVEADPAGGDWSLMLAGPDGQVLPAKPSLAELAVDAARKAPDAERVWASALSTSAGVPVVCGLSAAAPMAALLREYGRPIATWLAGLPNVVADVGRLAPETSALPILAASTVVVVVLDDRHDAFYRLTDLLPGLGGVIDAEEGIRSVVLPVVIASARRGKDAAGEVDELLAQRHLPAHRAAWLPREQKAIGPVIAGAGTMPRSGLLRAARDLASVVASEQYVVTQQREQRRHLAAASRTDAAAQWRGIGVVRGA